MPRTPRQHCPGFWYHVFNRGARRWNVFLDDDDRRRFLRLIGRVVSDHGVEAHAYCLMSNHFHLVMRCPQHNLSEAMKEVGQRYTQDFNRVHDFDGPLFRGRFGSVPISSDAQLLTAVRYVVRNPLAIAGIDAPEHHEWSSHLDYIGGRTVPRWLSTDTVLELHGGPARYAAFVCATEIQPVVADDDWPEVARAVLAVTGEHADALSTSTRGQTNEARLLLALCLSEMQGCTAAEIVGSFGWRNVSTVRGALHRARKQRSEDPRFAGIWLALSTMLSSAEAA